MTAAIKSKWPSAAAELHNDDLVPVDASLMYHQPGVACARLAEEFAAGRARRVQLVRALVFCRPCSCWQVRR